MASRKMTQSALETLIENIESCGSTESRYLILGETSVDHLEQVLRVNGVKISRPVRKAELIASAIKFFAPCDGPADSTERDLEAGSPKMTAGEAEEEGCAASEMAEDEPMTVIEVGANLDPDPEGEGVPDAVNAVIEADKANPTPVKAKKAPKAPKAPRRYLPETYNGINLPEKPLDLSVGELQSLYFSVTGRETKSEDVKHLAWMLMRATREDAADFLARKRSTNGKTSLAEAWEKGFEAGRSGGLSPLNPYLR